MRTSKEGSSPACLPREPYVVSLNAENTGVCGLRFTGG